MDRNTVRVLEFDGGGVRGYLSLKYFQAFLAMWGINPNEIWKYFDVIAGTSIGAIQALSYAFGKSPDEIEPFFLEKSKRIFTTRSVPIGCDTGNDSNTPNALQKGILILQNDPFYKSPCAVGEAGPQDTGSNFGSNILHQTLVDNFGDSLMSSLKTKVIIPAYEKDTDKYVVFSNYPNSTFFIGENEKIVNVARATSAAPVYLPKHGFNGHDYADGGMYWNNPTNAALSLAMKMKPRANRACVLSIGTGLGARGFQNDVKSNTDTSTISDIFSLFDIASVGGQESVDFDLKLRSSGTLERLYYHRWQPKLDSSFNTELDNSKPEFLEYMAKTAKDQFAANIAPITKFIAHLEA